MTDIGSRLDLTEIFSDVDDFCQMWEKSWAQVPQIASADNYRQIKSKMTQSEGRSTGGMEIWVQIAFDYQRARRITGV
jgi:hypothetical protein